MARVPIGTPISNTRVYILDKHRQVVPVGAIGEIYIGGAGVAMGYLNRPALTSERFIPDPFITDPHALLYRTGDLGRWLPDGNIEFLGRNDHQVKVRGFRIELGEIEAHFAHHPRVANAAVIAREDVPGQKRLVAYIISRGEVAPSAEQLRKELLESMPEYMVPSAFVALDRLPLTVNGKLDRRALPAPPLEAHVTREYEPPTGEIEEGLASIWQELLQVERIGRGDNFFELGGHSLLATQVAVRVRSRLSVDISVSAIFECPTLQQLATRLQTLDHARLMERLARAGDRAQDLLEQVASMSEAQVQLLMKELATGGRA
jgi:acyl carrier protein